jgi:NAD(P)-dependent dehydrogenase (short-subunit alcohol dehydrogenase family)
MNRFEGKVVLVTGGNSGMGEALARRVAAEGGVAVLGARRKDRGDEVVAGIRADGGTAEFVPTDVTVEADVARLVATAVERFGRLDAAFNNAGGGSSIGPLHELTEDAWRAEIDLNLTSTFLSLKYEVPALLASGGGTILNNASVAGVVGIPNVAAYVAAKHAVVGLTRAAALELAESRVRVNALVAGGVDTPLFRRGMGSTEELAAQMAGMHPMERIARPEEIASFAAYLLSGESTFITGAALAIDGGWTAR